jgi:plastocyanin
MNFTTNFVIMITSIVLITASYAHEANAVCVIGPNGSTICAGMSQTISIAKSNSTVAYNGIPNVIITLDCAANDIRYGDYFNTCYQPTTLYVKSGTVVTWQNDDTWQHTVTYGNPWSALSQGYFFDSKAMGQGEGYSYQFKYTGAYPYYDAFNWWETGLVIVK